MWLASVKPIEWRVTPPARYISYLKSTLISGMEKKLRAEKQGLAVWSWSRECGQYQISIVHCWSSAEAELVNGSAIEKYSIHYFWLSRIIFLVNLFFNILYKEKHLIHFHFSRVSASRIEISGNIQAHCERWWYGQVEKVHGWLRTRRIGSSHGPWKFVCCVKSFGIIYQMLWDCERTDEVCFRSNL